MIIKTIGNGTFGKVVLARHIRTNEEVAIKILDRSAIQRKEQLIRLNREIHFLKHLHHKNIISLYEVIETQDNYNILMEYAQYGDLFSYITMNTKLKENKAIDLFIQLIDTLSYIHKEHVAHRDLKPENILLVNNYNTLKLTDFGLSNKYNYGDYLKTPCGSPFYAAPETIMGQKYLGEYSDVWSSGVILFVMLSGKLPFQGDNTQMIFESVLSGKYIIPDYLSPGCKNLIKKILEIDPKKRISIREIINHPFIKERYEEYKKKDSEETEIINEEVIDKMISISGIQDRNVIVSNLSSNQYNEITTCYKLLLKKYKKNGCCFKDIDFPQQIKSTDSIDSTNTSSDKIIKKSNDKLKKRNFIKSKNNINDAHRNKTEKNLHTIQMDKKEKNKFLIKKEKSTIIKKRTHKKNALSINDAITSHSIQSHFMTSLSTEKNNISKRGLSSQPNTENSNKRINRNVKIPSHTITLHEPSCLMIKTNKLKKSKNKNTLKIVDKSSTSSEKKSMTILTNYTQNNPKHKRAFSNYNFPSKNQANSITERDVSSNYQSHKNINKQKKDKNNFRHQKIPLTVKTKTKNIIINLSTKPKQLNYQTIYTKKNLINKDDSNFVICSTKLKEEEIINKLTDMCTNNKYVLEKEEINRYICSLEENKISLLISKTDNSNIIKMSQLKGEEKVTKEMIKTIIFDIGF